jgi:RimJ/RimL family protein N-acetyltransferase
LSRTADTTWGSGPISDLAQRVKRGVRRHGPIGTIRLALKRAWQRFRLVESHVWYQTELDDDRPRAPIPREFHLVRASAGDLGVVERFGPVSPADAERRHREGASLWLLLDDQERPVFSCWTFVDRFPVFAAEGGSLALRKGTAALEDSYTAAEYRGKHLGPATLCAVVDLLAAAGVDHLITKIAEDNQPARKASERVGFKEIATMKTRRLLWFRPRVDLRVLGDGEGPFLGHQLNGAAPARRD